MNSSETILSHERMEEMAADYALGSLAEADIPLFELSLPQYPDIQEDVRRIREAFAQFDKEDMLERQTRSVRTLSVHVQQQLGSRRSLFANRSLRHAVPALGLAVVALFLFAPGGLVYRSGSTMDVASPESAAVTRSTAPSLAASLVTQDDVRAILADTKSADPVAVAVGISASTSLSDVDLMTEFDAAFGDELALSDEMAVGLADNELFPLSDYSLGGGLYDGMEEVEVQQLLEELDNAIL